MADGFRLGPWALDRKIREDGDVSLWVGFRARSPAERVWIRVFRPRDYVSARKKFVLQLSSLHKLGHERIVRLIDMGSADAEQALYLVTEYAQGMTLQARLHEGPLQHELARQVFADLSTALVHAHERGVFPWLLSLRSALITPRGRGLLVDFGVEVEGGNAWEQRALHYVPPDDLGSRLQSADVYALGMMLYECVEGRRAFAYDDGEDESAARQRLRAWQFEQPNLSFQVCADEDLRALIRLAIQPDPNVRNLTMATMFQRLSLPVGRLAELPKALTDEVMGPPMVFESGAFYSAESVDADFVMSPSIGGPPSLDSFPALQHTARLGIACASAHADAQRVPRG